MWQSNLFKKGIFKNKLVVFKKLTPPNEMFYSKINVVFWVLFLFLAR